MKLTKQWIGTLFTVASASMAFACGCSTQNVRIEPVREMIVRQPLCVAERTVTVSTPLCPTGQRQFDLVEPFRLAGRAISSPFVAMGRSSDNYIAPVGERLSYSTATYQPSWSGETLLPVGERFTTVRSYRTMDLQPVGERFTTVRSYRTMDLQPVGERFIIRRGYYTNLEPVGERFIIKKSYHKSTLKPVGERTLIVHKRHHKMIKPVGEQFIVKKSYHKTTLKPVGEKTLIIKGKPMHSVQKQQLKSSQSW